MNAGAFVFRGQESVCNMHHWSSNNSVARGNAVSFGETDIYVRYARKLPGKAEALGILIARLRDDQLSTETLQQARRQAHQLKGTAGAYGHQQVSQCADRLEQALDAVDGLDWPLLSRTMEELSDAASAAGSLCECAGVTLCGSDTRTVSTLY